MNLQHVLFLARWYPNRYDPMPGLFIHRHAAAVARFLPVSLLYVMPSQSSENIRMAETSIEQVDGVFVFRIYYPPVANNIPFISAALRLIRFYYYLWTGFQNIKHLHGRPSLVHVNVLSRLGVFALFLKMIFGIPYIITEHWSRYLEITGTYKGFLRKIITRIIVRQAGALTTVSNNLAKAMQAHGLHNSNYTRVNNVVLDAFFGKTEVGTNKIPVMVHVSCFEDRSKNISGLLRAIEKIKNKKIPFQMIMIGDGEDFTAMKSLSQNLGLIDKDIVFTGLLEGNELITEMAKADFMVMFSNYENMPVVISEAMALGMPVIATSVGGIPEHVDDTRGRLVKPGDEDALIHTLLYMCSHHHDFDRASIRKYALKEFSYESVGQEFVRIYNTLIR
ncbi:MAG: glycosyltransferase [Bacteroidales bacterium]|nr:glycosyltransferase [Bacteroidales bacterium]